MKDRVSLSSMRELAGQIKPEEDIMRSPVCSALVRSSGVLDPQVGLNRAVLGLSHQSVRPDTTSRLVDKVDKFSFLPFPFSFLLSLHSSFHLSFLLYCVPGVVPRTSQVH